MRASAISKAPFMRVRPCSDGSRPRLASNGSACVSPIVLSNRTAAFVLAAEPGADLVEELPGDLCSVASGIVPGDGDGVGDTPLEWCQIGNHRVKDDRAEVTPHFR